MAHLELNRVNKGPKNEWESIRQWMRNYKLSLYGFVISMTEKHQHAESPTGF